MSSACLDQKWSKLNEKFEKILKNSEPEQNYDDTIDLEPVQPNFEQPSVIPKNTCGACGENYPEDVKFCPSCNWEDLPASLRV